MEDTIQNETTTNADDQHAPSATEAQRAANGALANDEKKGSLEVTEAYVRELRNQNKELRIKAKETAEEVEKAKKRIEEMESKTYRRIVDAEVKLVASKLKLRDREDVKLADLSGVSIDENGEVVGVEEALSALKDRKPYLFEGASTSSSVYERPAPVQEQKPGWVKDLSDKDYEKARAALLGR